MHNSTEFSLELSQFCCFMTNAEKILNPTAINRKIFLIIVSYYTVIKSRRKAESEEITASH